MAETSSTPIKMEAERGQPYVEFISIKADNPYGDDYYSETCTEEQWDAIDPNDPELLAQLGAESISKNGPRTSLADGWAQIPGGTITVEGAEFTLVATVALTGGGAYTASDVNRTSQYIFKAGLPVFLLIDVPSGRVYIMQTYSRQIEPTLDEESLANLQLTKLPPNWIYTSITLEEEFVLDTNGKASVINDEFKNSYQWITGS